MSFGAETGGSGDPAGPCASALSSAGVEDRRQRLRPPAQANDPSPGVADHPPGQADQVEPSAFMRLAAQLSPSAKRFIAAFRLNARIASAHHAASAPNSPDGSCPRPDRISSPNAPPRSCHNQLAATR